MASSDYTDDLRLAHLLADNADSITMSRFKSLDLQVSTKPDMTEVTDADERQHRPAFVHPRAQPGKDVREPGREPAVAGAVHETGPDHGTAVLAHRFLGGETADAENGHRVRVQASLDDPAMRSRTVHADRADVNQRHSAIAGRGDQVLGSDPVHGVGFLGVAAGVRDRVNDHIGPAQHAFEARRIGEIGPDDTRSRRRNGLRPPRDCGTVGSRAGQRLEYCATDETGGAEEYDSRRGQCGSVGDGSGYGVR